ncbi:MAG: PIN domain-containing protein [Spirochaetaceae bacterium]|nr:MAG: PIN domain-containing protein [Spirochaetaceae bacterium]
MAMSTGSLLLLDTNVLLAATNSARDQHAYARELFGVCRDAGVHTAVCGQILREYLAVCTRPATSNGFGMDTSQALQNMRWFRAQCVFLEETFDVFQTFIKIVVKYGTHGTRMHDANIAAVCLTYAIDRLVTLNAADFSYHPGITLGSPAEILQELDAI